MAKKEFNCKHCGATFLIDVSILRLACDVCVAAGHALFGECALCRTAFENDIAEKNQYPRITKRTPEDDGWKSAA